MVLAGKIFFPSLWHLEYWNIDAPVSLSEAVGSGGILIEEEGEEEKKGATEYERT